MRTHPLPFPAAVGRVAGRRAFARSFYGLPFRRRLTPAQRVFRELASGGRVRALPQRPRRAGGAGGAFPGPAGYPPRPFDTTRTRRRGDVGLTKVGLPLATRSLAT